MRKGRIAMFMALFIAPFCLVSYLAGDLLTSSVAFIIFLACFAVAFYHYLDHALKVWKPEPFKDEDGEDAP